jgi:hypothetical protein
VSVPLVPVTVNVYVPVGVVLDVCTLNVELPAGGRAKDVGFRVHIVFAGQPLTVRLTVPLKLLSGVAVTV